MKFTTSFIISFFLLLEIFSCSSSDNDPGAVAMVNEMSKDNNSSDAEEKPNEKPTPETVVIGDWQLEWEDNFDTDLSAWDVWEGGAFNNEIQLYRNEQLSVTNGILSIHASRMKISGKNNPFDTTEKNFDYVSGRIESKKTFGPENTNGKREYRIVSRIKLPKGFGMWPAFWTFADPWPTKGEIDIFEARGNEPNTLASNIFYGAQAGNSQLNQSDTKKEYTVTLNTQADFHEYELIWNKEGIQILFDGKQLGNYQASEKNGLALFFGSKHKIILNLAVGGVFFPPNSNPNDFTDTATMEVDWVKIYKR